VPIQERASGYVRSVTQPGRYLPRWSNEHAGGKHEPDVVRAEFEHQ